MSEEILKEIIIDTINGEEHLGDNLKNQCVNYIEQLKNKVMNKDLEYFEKLSEENMILHNEIKKLNLEAQRYFDCAMDLINEKNIILDWLESKNNITLQQHKTIEPVIKVKEVIDKIKEMD